MAGTSDMAGQNLQMEEADFALQIFTKFHKISQIFATCYSAKRSLSTPHVTGTSNAWDECVGSHKFVVSGLMACKPTFHIPFEQ